MKEFGESETLEGNALHCHGRTFAEHGVDVFASDVVARVEDLFANAEEPTLARMRIPNVEHVGLPVARASSSRS